MLVGKKTAKDAKSAKSLPDEELRWHQMRPIDFDGNGFATLYGAASKAKEASYAFNRAIVS